MLPDLLKLAVELAIAEEARRIQISVPEISVPEQRVTTKVTTKVVRLVNVRLPDELVDVRGMGKMKEMTIRSRSNNYCLRVTVDGNDIYNSTYSWFEAVSAVAEEIAAFQDDNGNYVLHLRDISFTDRLVIYAYPSIDNVVLDEVFCKYDISV
jgi:hypothetical protein